MARRKGLSFYKRKKKISAALLHEILSYLLIIFIASLLAVVLVYSIGMCTNMIGVSMEPNLYNGQEILVNRLSVRLLAPRKGDVLVFLPNGNENSHYYVKRVVALPGESVQIKDGHLYVNGNLYTDFEYDKIADAGIAEQPIRLSNDEYFVLGDNVNNSEDSRSANIGPVKRDDIRGKVWFHMAAGDSSIGLMK
ncbi:MAG: signal peptidase I [Lachnospiraceae bacterium]|nr:signal peptidase I [Lachnospiraceae bacterium]